MIGGCPVKCIEHPKFVNKTSPMPRFEKPKK